MIIIIRFLIFRRSGICASLLFAAVLILFPGQCISDEESNEKSNERTQETAPEIRSAESASDSLLTVYLKDGTTLRGRITGENENSLTFVTFSGIEIEVPKTSIISISIARGRVEDGTFYRFDPNYSRLLFAPTGRPLRRGDGYFSDYYVFFPGISYGVTDKFSFMAGMSVIPGLGIADQLRYLAPRIGLYNTDELALSAGVLYVSFSGGNSAGITFLTGTLGPQDKCLTAGLGFGYIDSEDEPLEFSEKPIIMLGGNIRLSNNIALVSENWFLTFGDFKLKHQPFSLAVRFFGDRLAVDAGAIIIGELISEGFPIPWLSFVYNFGK